MVPRHFIFPFLFLLLASSPINVSAAKFFRKLRLGSSRQDAKGQSDSPTPPPPPPPERPGLPPQRKTPRSPAQPITITRRLELWYRPGDNLLAVEVKGQLGGTEPPYIVEGPPGEKCDPNINTPETLNTVDAKRMRQANLRQYNVRLIQEELVNARHAMYDDNGKYKSGNAYVTGIQDLLDSMIHVLDSGRDPDGDVMYKNAVERYRDVAEYRGSLQAEEWRSYPLSSFTFEWGNPGVVEVFDSRSCGKRDKCHDQTVEFSGQGRVGLSPPVIYRVCACAVLKG